MNNVLITAEQRIVLLANGRESLENPDFDPAMVVSHRQRDAGHCLAERRRHLGKPRPWSFNGYFSGQVQAAV